MVNHPYADFDRRMVAEWEAKLQTASEAGDVAAFLHAERELANYRSMLAQSLSACAETAASDSLNQ